MRKSLWNFLSPLFFFVCAVHDTYAIDYINTDSSNVMIFNDTTVAESVSVYNMSIMNSANIINNGIINGYVGVCYGCDVYLQNSGDINAVFDIPNSSKIVQVIHDSGDLNPISASNNFQVFVDGADQINWNLLKDISRWADKLVLNNSGLIISKNDGVENEEIFSPNVELQGNVILYVDDISAFYGKPILSNVSGDGHFSILTDEVDPLYKLYTYTLDNNIYVETVRETDYAKIFKNDVGNFLNDLRNSQSDNKLLLKLDNATSLAEMDEIMSASVRLNPLKLMDVVNVFNMFEINEISNVSDRISISPIFIFSNDFTISGLSFNADYGFYKNLRAGLSLYSAKTKIKSNIEDYESALYGGNVHIAYFDDSLMARAMAGITNAKFDIGSVFDGTNTVMDPSGKSHYYVADMGFNFNVSKRFLISPFMRVGFNSSKLLNSEDNYYIAGVGADLLFDASMYGIEYKYGLNVSTYTNEQINAAFKIDINSVADKAGGYLNLGLVYDELKRVGYKIQVGVNFKL